MRSSLVGLQLLLACVLVQGTSVVEGKKENSTLQVLETQEEKPLESNLKGPENQGFAASKRMLLVPKESNSEELEERGKEYRKGMQDHGSPFEATLLKEQALDYFNKRVSGPFYRPIEDTDVRVKSATGTMLIFTHFLVNTNCTKEEGRSFSALWYERPSTNLPPCVALPKQEQKKLRCRVYMFLDAESSHSAVVKQDCEPVVFWDGSEDTLDINHLLDFSTGRFGPY